MDEKHWAISVLTSAKADLRDDIWSWKNRNVLHTSDEYRQHLIERAERRIREIDEALDLLEAKQQQSKGTSTYE